MELVGDFHTHMNGNGVVNRWNNIVNLCRMAKNLGYNAISLGCHDYVCPMDLRKRAEQEFELTIIPAAEITTNGGHLLAYNIDYIPQDGWANNKNPLDVIYAIHMVHNLGGKAVMAHPYPKKFGWASRFEEVAHMLDGAEIANYKSFLREKIVEFEVVKKYPHLQLFRNSDCHPWEGDRMHPDFHTKIDSGWFDV